MASKQIPHNSCLANIVAHHQPTSPSLAHIVDRDQLDLFGMPLKPSLQRQCVMVKTNDGRALCVEEERSRGRAWLEIEMGNRCGRLRRRGYRRRLGVGDGPVPRKLGSGHVGSFSAPSQTSVHLSGLVRSVDGPLVKNTVGMRGCIPRELGRRQMLGKCFEGNEKAYEGTEMRRDLS